MIRNAARLMLAVTVLGCLLIAGTLLIARGIPAPPTESLIAHSPCDLPCFYGVTPGETRSAGALAAFSAYTDALHIRRDLEGFPFVDANGNTAYVSLLFDNNQIVIETRLWALDTDANIGQLGELLLVDRKPTHVFRTCGSVLPARFLLTFGAHDELLVELFVQDDLAPQTPISLIDVSAGWRALDSARTSFGCTVETDWFGFAPLWKYFAVRQEG